MTYWRAAIGLFFLFTVIAYLGPSDALYAFTIWPPFVWAGLGTVATLVGIRRFRSRYQVALILAWVAFWLVFGEERKWIPSRWLEPPAEAAKVVSLNCAGGSTESAREALSTLPDLALLQESPSQPNLERLVAELYGAEGAVLCGPDASIVVRGKIVPIPLNFGNTSFVVAAVESPKLGSFLAVSLRFAPPVFRMDYWNPDCWREYAENRRARRKEFEEMVEYVKDLAPTRLIIGGDFNTPPDRGTFAPFEGWVEPATDDSGYTAVNDFPMARIDQVWVRGFKVHRSRATRTATSDHRIVTLGVEQLEDPD